MTRAINDPGNEDPGSLLETDADALLGGAAAQAPEERRRLAAQACIRACERYLALCIESSREQRQHAGDCADLCRLAALLLERRSPWAPAACELAARYALACAERCDGDEPLERECAECLPALRRGLPAIVAGLRLAISAVVVLSLNVLGKLISLPAPASRFAFPGEPPLQASVRTGDIADRCAELPEKDHDAMSLRDEFISKS
ncbi:four-helix bundle copper-binding protein [Pseudomonas aeruginosa]|nr:four-helix bundle copper-binding protein [Pseudomonas aeruginosa]